MNKKLTELFCPLKEAIWLHNIVFPSMVANWFIDRRSEIVMLRESPECELMRLFRPNDMVPTWTIAELGKALGNEIVFRDYRRLEVICTGQYAGLRDDATDKWYSDSLGFEACYDSPNEARNRAKLLIYCIEHGFITADIFSKTLHP